MPGSKGAYVRQTPVVSAQDRDDTRCMPKPRTDALLATAMKIAAMAIEERANAEDFEELALVLLELDEAIVTDGESVPRRWSRGRRPGRR